MNRVDGERDEWRRERNGLFWIERLFLFLVFVFPTYVFHLIVPLILSTTLLALPFFFFLIDPNLSSVGPSGIGGFWLFLLDRSTFYLFLEYSKLLAGGFELTFLWRLIVSLSVVIHSIYIADHLLLSPPPSQTPIFTGDVHKEVVEKELVEDGKKMIHSGLETLRKEWRVFRDDGMKEMNILVEHMICSKLDDLRSNVAEDIRALRQDGNKDVKSVANQLDETYLAIQETYKEAKATTEKALESYLMFEQGQNKRGMIRGEDVEGFVELREKVRRMSENAAEQQARATGELVDARIQQWEEDNVDYLASLPLLYFNQHN